MINQHFKVLFDSMTDQQIVDYFEKLDITVVEFVQIYENVVDVNIVKDVLKSNYNFFQDHRRMINWMIEHPAASVCIPNQLLDSISGWTWAFMLIKQPKLDIVCRWDKLCDLNWRQLLQRQPRFKHHPMYKLKML